MWESLSQIFSWTARGSLYAVGAIAIIVLAQILLRRALTERWSYALWMILLARLVIPVGPEWEMSLWNLAPNKLMHWMKSDTAVIYQAQSAGRNPVWTRPMRGSIPPAVGKSATTQGNAKLNAQSKHAVSESASVGSTLFSILPAAWLVGALAVLSGIIFSNLRLWRSLRGLRFSTDSALLELFEDCRQRMLVRTTVGLVVTDRVKSPLLFGFFRPRVLVPEDLVRQIPAEQLRYIFLHELAHLKRHDILVGWLLAFLQALHWFNPLIWWAFSRMRFDRELACDASVLVRVPDGERRHYGGTLIGMLEHFGNTQHLPAVAGILENGTQLKRRLTMITKFQPPTRLAGIWAVILIVVLSSAMLTEASSDAGKVAKSADELAVEQMITEQNVKYVTRYTIIFSNGLRLETYLPSYLSPAHTGGFALQKVFIQRVDPVYPEAARAAGVSGQVVFLVTLDKDGSIIRAIRRMGNPMLADAAATAMRQWKASPMGAGNLSFTFPIEFVFRPDGSVDTAQTAPTLGAGRIRQNELDSYPGGFPKPEDFLIGEPPDGLAALSKEAAPQFVPATPMDR